MERLAKAVSDAAKWGATLESEVFQGSFAEDLRPLTEGYESLPKELIDFSSQLGGMLDLLGKPGHKEEYFATQLLTWASEFVWLKAGYYYDEPLSDLFQQIEGSSTLSDELSGEAIRKKRDYLKKHYPHLYAKSREMAENSCKSSHKPDIP